MKNLLIFILIALFTQSLYCQEYEFVGVLKFDMTTVISYRIIFTESNGKITGYSITDMQGENETKNKIEGNYDKNTGKFSFREKDIEYTKSEVVQTDFCYIHFKSVLKLGKDNKLKGNFNGFFKDGSKCVDGILNMVSEKKAHERIVKMNNKVQQSKKIDEETKKVANLEVMMEELKLNMLTDEGITTIFTTDDVIEMEVWDMAKEDGDKVTIYCDNKIILNSYEIKATPKKIKVPLAKKETFIKIKALNSGEVAPNTSRVKFTDSIKALNFIANLEEGKISLIKIIKKGK